MPRDKSIILLMIIHNFLSSNIYMQELSVFEQKLTKRHCDNASNKENFVEFEEVDVLLGKTKISFEFQIKALEDAIRVTEKLGDEFRVLKVK